MIEQLKRDFQFLNFLFWEIVDPGHCERQFAKSEQLIADLKAERTEIQNRIRKTAAERVVIQARISELQEQIQQAQSHNQGEAPRQPGS